MPCWTPACWWPRQPDHEAELEEVSGHEREQQTRRQLLIPSPHLGITVPSAVTRVNHVTVFGQTLGLASGGTE